MKRDERDNSKLARCEVITLAEELGLLIPTTVDYQHPSHMRLISKLEKFAEECYQAGWSDGATETIEKERG